LWRFEAGNKGASCNGIRLGTLARRVERGEVPDKMMASHFTNGVVDRVAAYKGGGSTDDAATFVCKTP
jgi:hypothetical protein